MRPTLLALAVLAAGPSFAQGAAEDPCALALYHYDRAAEADDSTERVYRQNVLSMASVAAAAVEVDVKVALGLVRAGCAYDPAQLLSVAVARVIEAKHVSDASDLQAEMRAVQARATASQKQVAEERKKIEVLRARISELIAERDALRQ